MIESAPADPSSLPVLHVDLAQVCVVDGIWQDLPDQIAAFDEARLAASVSGRGNLYVLLDVSGEIEGRAEIERELIETIRREYAARRGSITFGLSEALRAANAMLYELNLSAAREARRMAGISAVVLRGQDLYIAQAGPAVVFVEINGTLQRYPAESDWFTEDQPLLNAQGNVSAPLGVYREFACDLFHAAVTAGDVFVLATRPLTQLANTEELAQAFANRGAEDIGDFLEDVANGSDLCALVAELVDPRDLTKIEPPAPVEAVVPEFGLAAHELPLGAETAAAEAEEEPPRAEALTPTPEESPEQNLVRLREERRRQREAQIGALGRTLGGAGRALVALVALVGGAFARTAQLVDWSRVSAGVNRALNMLFAATWRALALFIRLILPGAPSRQQALLPRRASKEPLWLKGVAVVLPMLFVGLAFGLYKQQDFKRETQAAELVREADSLEQAAENNPDKNAAREQLKQALARIDQARGLDDTLKARGVFFKIQDQMNEVDGTAVLYYFFPIAAIQNERSSLTQVYADDNDIYILDSGAQRIYHYVVNDSGTKSDPAAGDGTILKSGDKVGNTSVDQVRDIVWAEASGSAKAALVAIAGNALLQYDPTSLNWRASVVSDAPQWGEIRAVASFLGNVYLLDGAKNQIWKYVPAANGYGQQASPYLPANSSTSLSQVVDLTIDGDVWALNADGSVLRFRSGQRIAFQLSGLETPLKNPVAIFTRPEVDAIYIADAGNQRIVEFDKNGKFVRQFKPRAQDGAVFNALKTLFANETKRKFYFINGNTVYVANVPK
jgi:hypothetical protein